MKIKKEILDKIFTVANSEKNEIGGILGSSAKGIITDMVADPSKHTERCRFEYYPDIHFLNTRIEEWARYNIEFQGLFHTHFSGSRSLSDPDKEYIRTIMIGAKGLVASLYFPVFTLPDNTLNVYKSYWVGEEIIIESDELEIV